MKTTTRSTAKGQKRKRAVADVAVPAEAGAAVTSPVPAETASPETSLTETVILETTSEQAATAATIALSGICSIKEVAALRQSLCAMVDTPAPIAIDASAVERIDTATLQLLYAFVRDRVAADREVFWQGVTAALADAVCLLGMRDLLRLPAAAELAA